MTSLGIGTPLLFDMSPGFPGMKVLEPLFLCHLDLSVHWGILDWSLHGARVLENEVFPRLCQFRVILCQKEVAYGTWTLCPVLGKARGSQLGFQGPITLSCPCVRSSGLAPERVTVALTPLSVFPFE